MNNISGNGWNFLRSHKFVFVLIALFILGACGDSGTGDEQAQSTAPETPDAVTPEAITTDDAPLPDEDPATMEQEAAAVTGESAAPPATEQAEAETEVAVAEEVDGRQVYYTYCAVCHKSGLNAAPKYGNKALWAKRIEQGREVMYKHAIEGLRGMPPRGGIPSLSDAQVKAATDFMVGAAGGWGDN